LTDEELYAIVKRVFALSPERREMFMSFLALQESQDNQSLEKANAAPDSSRDDVLEQVSEPPRLHHDIITGGRSCQT